MSTMGTTRRVSAQKRESPMSESKDDLVRDDEDLVFDGPGDEEENGDDEEDDRDEEDDKPDESARGH